MQDKTELLPFSYDISKPNKPAESQAGDIVVTASVPPRKDYRLPLPIEPETEVGCRRPTNERMQQDMLSVRRGLRACLPEKTYEAGEVSLDTTRIRRPRLQGRGGNAGAPAVRGTLHF